MDQALVLLIGFLASIATYLAKTFVVEPLLRFRAVRCRIQNQLKFYSNAITNSGLDEDVVKKARVALRQLSCDLEETYSAIGLRAWLAAARAVPKPQSVDEAGTKLIYLSNATNMTGREIENNDALEAAREDLGIS